MLKFFRIIYFYYCAHILETGLHGVEKRSKFTSGSHCVSGRHCSDLYFCWVPTDLSSQCLTQEWALDGSDEGLCPCSIAERCQCYLWQCVGRDTGGCSGQSWRSCMRSYIPRRLIWGFSSAWREGTHKVAECEFFKKPYRQLSEKMKVQTNS